MIQQPEPLLQLGGERRAEISNGGRVELGEGQRSGNPRPLGRKLPVIPASGYGVMSDTRTRIQMSPRPPSDDAVVDLSQPLETYINGDAVSVRPGYVGNVMPTIGGVALDATTPPTLTPAEGDNWVHLKGTYEPSVYELGAGYAAIGSAGIVSVASFVLTATTAPSPAEDYPKISGGGATDGHFDILWGKIVKDGDSLTIETPSGGGDASVVFMPPNLYVAFRDTNISAPAAP